MSTDHRLMDTEGGQIRQAIIYARVSDPKQKTQGHGLTSQETRCREYAALRGYRVIETFNDDFTGGRADRPGMEAMLGFLRKNRSKRLVVIIDDISRLARGVTAHWELRESIARAGGELVSPSIEFGEDSDSKLIENMLASVSQHQREKNAEQVKNRMRARAQNGYWGFWAPRGYTYEAKRGEGKVLVRDEPLASVVQEALEGYASGRFQTPAEVKRFLETQPAFPKDLPGGKIRHQRISDLLRQPLYAGYIEVPNWNVSLRPARHEGLIDFLTFKKIQERLDTRALAPARKDISADFPLRGFVSCGSCGNPLTAGWSHGKLKQYPYYLCHTRGCPSYKKSIRRADIEGEFETLLTGLRPGPALFKTAVMMFKEVWEHRLTNAAALARSVSEDIAKLEREIGKMVDRVIIADSPALVTAYENRIREMEQDKHVLTENAARFTAKRPGFETAFRTPLSFLANPIKLWNSNALEQKRTVLKLAFASRPQYVRGEGFRTLDMALPFKALADLRMSGNGVVEPRGIEPLTSSLRTTRSPN